MQIEYIDVDELTPYSKNVKKHTTDQIEALCISIKEFGFDQPIVVDKHRVIIKGHGRWKAAKELGIDLVPVVIADKLSSEEVKMARLADNDVVSTEWDNIMLRDDLFDIKEEEGDISFSCVSEGEFERIIQATKESNIEVSGLYVDTIQTTVDCPKCGYRW